MTPAKGREAELGAPVAFTRTWVDPVGTSILIDCAPAKSDQGTLKTLSVDAVPVRKSVPEESCSLPVEVMASQVLLIEARFEFSHWKMTCSNATWVKLVPQPASSCTVLVLLKNP